MSDFRRRLMMGSGVLPYDAEVEYLETDGTNPAGFELPIQVNRATDALEITYQQTTNVNQARFFLSGTGADYSTGKVTNTDNVADFYVNNTGKYGLWATNWSNPINLTIGTYKDIVNVDYKNGKFYLNGYAANATDGNNVSSGNLYLLFGNNTNPLFKGKFYGFRFWRNGVLQMDCIPVRRGNVGYLYDKIGRVLYSNPCVGSFALGADTGDISKYTRVDYILNAGNSYIVTGFIPNQDTKVWFDMQLSSVTQPSNVSNPSLFGAEKTQKENAFCVSFESLGNLQAQFGTTENANETDISLSADRLTGELSKNSFTVNGSSYAVGSVSNFNGTYNMLIFDRGFTRSVTTLHKVANSNSSFLGYLYGFKIWDGETLVRDFVPVRNQLNVYGLWDLVYNKFYRSNSPTAFTGGNLT